MEAVIVTLLVVLGSALGSFFNVLIDRLPRKKSIIKPASHCTECGTSIKFYHNIPILSYLLLRGKCRKCGIKIHWHHLLVEVITPILLVALFYRHGIEGVLFYKYAILTCFMIPIFFIDAFHHLIPHVLSIPLILLGVLFSLVPGTDVGIVNAVITAGTVFCMLIIIAWGYLKLRQKDGLGGGDIWLLTGLATFFGAITMPFVFLLAAFSGIIFFVLFIRNRDLEFAFGNFIALAAVTWALIGDYILDFIL